MEGMLNKKSKYLVQLTEIKIYHIIWQQAPKYKKNNLKIHKSMSKLDIA